jgi:hypothetical protein
MGIPFALGTHHPQGFFGPLEDILGNVECLSFEFDIGGVPGQATL